MAAGLVGMAFIPYYNHLMKILDTNAELRKTARGIFKLVGLTAGGTLLGCMVDGPLGAVMGAMAGLLLGYVFSSDYNSLITVLRNLREDDKAKLVEKVQELVGSTSIEAVTGFIGTQAGREALLNLLQTFANVVKA